MNKLKITQFGNPILRKVAKPLLAKDISNSKTQQLVKGMQSMLLDDKLGIGLAAPQVGKGIALAVIAIRSSKTRPDAESFDLVLINPEIIERSADVEQLWEGCISSGSHGSADLFAKVPRNKKITLKYLDEKGKQQVKNLEGLQAQVVQHEVDHINGILFVDLVTDTKTYMTYQEYLKMRDASI